jgi:hypothetical protein
VHLKSSSPSDRRNLEVSNISWTEAYFSPLLVCIALLVRLGSLQFLSDLGYSFLSFLYKCRPHQGMFSYF